MFKLPKLQELDVAGKRVILRLDLDTDPDPDDLRIKSSGQTVNYLHSKNARVVIIAHKGRPTGDKEKDRVLSLEPFRPLFPGCEIKENLRFNPGEEAGDMDFAGELASEGDIYINEAFATSHRNSASITILPKLLPHAAGLRFVEEVENLSKVFENPARPLLFIISGAKEDKLQSIDGLEKYADRILVGGRLPVFLGDKALESVRNQEGKVIIGNLIMDKEDITLNTVERFEKEIEKAKTIVVSGPPGRFEDDGHRQGTERVLRKVAENKEAFKVAGGGDTEKVLASLSLSQYFDWVSVGGGAMLEFLSKRTLPGIEALVK